MDRLDAREGVVTFGALARSGFRRWSTYRQATIAGAFTNVVFGFLRCYVILAVAAATAGGLAAGYDAEQLATYVWVGQGLITVVGMWGWTELADRIRTGEVAADLLRPVPPVVSYLAADLGRFGHAMLTRFVPPMVVGAIFFPLYVPHRAGTIPLFLVSVVLGTLVSFAGRFLVNATAYWLHDARGPIGLWTLASGVLAGLYFPLRLLPDWAAVLLYAALPFAGMLQIPADVLTERDGPALQAGLVAVQAVWAAGLLFACARVQKRAESKLVVQGG
ncbi:ABC-2 family transporter protein [Actinoplanes sp. NBRC 103695]|uniref:ABC transporter permease n=1 Tax=Actinoplanes sp. NBRC 103695 TaxID=3032202 RepID=UPI0024A01066|nr:ABC-2 family transporter protein [Actinoplanes sp. NBRC 103695]GLY93323.1 ABC transporter permease [Actinoplanes sp. NBRC 103695]